MTERGDDRPYLQEPDRARSRALATGSRQALLKALQAAGPLAASEAGTAVGLHRNTARVHLEVLSSLGVVSRRLAAPSGRGRPRVLYELPISPAAPSGAAKPPAHDRLAPLLAEQLTGLAAASQSAERLKLRYAGPGGNRGGAGALGEATPPEALELVAEVLRGLGLEPEADAGAVRIRLHACPFAGLDEHERATAHGIHVGILRAVVQHLGVPLDLVRLDQLVGEDPCVCTAQFRSRSAPLPPPGRAQRPASRREGR